MKLWSILRFKEIIIFSQRMLLTFYHNTQCCMGMEWIHEIEIWKIAWTGWLFTLCPAEIEGRNIIFTLSPKKLWRHTPFFFSWTTILCIAKQILQSFLKIKALLKFNVRSKVRKIVWKIVGRNSTTNKICNLPFTYFSGPESVVYFLWGSLESNIFKTEPLDVDD